MPTLSSKIRKVFEELEEVEKQEITLTKQLEKTLQKKEKLQQKLQELVNKTIPKKNKNDNN